MFKMSVNVCLDDIFSVCTIVSAQYLLNRSVVFYQTWYGGVLSSGDVLCGKIGSLSSMSKVTASAYIIRIGLFLLYLLNCWSVCNQIWFDSIVQHHKPECPVEKWDDSVQGQGYSKGSKCQ